LALVDKGLTRERAYELVQRNAMECWQTGRDFKELLKSDKDVMDYLTTDELEELFDYSYYLRHIDEIYSRFGL
jgi:adenylosuccinate lyase